MIGDAEEAREHQRRQQRRHAGAEIDADERAGDLVGRERKPDGDGRDDDEQQFEALAQPLPRRLAVLLRQRRNTSGTVAAATLEAIMTMNWRGRSAATPKMPAASLPSK